MQWQLRLCRRFDALSLNGCRPSVGLWPVHGCGLVPACNHRRVLSDSPAAKDPRWLMLNLSGCRTDYISVTVPHTDSVGYKNDFFVCDISDLARPKVRYVPVPAEGSRCCNKDDNDDKDLFPTKMGAAGASRVRFVSIDPQCCCRCPSRNTCAHSRFAFTVRTWTMDNEPLAWVKERDMNCEEVWTLAGYECLPRANLLCPVVTLGNPNVVCLLVSNRRLNTYGDLEVWMIHLKMKSKALLSVVPFTGDPWRVFDHLPVELQYQPENTR